MHLPTNTPFFGFFENKSCNLTRKPKNIISLVKTKTNYQTDFLKGDEALLELSYQVFSFCL